MLGRIGLSPFSRAIARAAARQFKSAPVQVNRSFKRSDYMQCNSSGRIFLPPIGFVGTRGQGRTSFSMISFVPLFASFALALPLTPVSARVLSAESAAPTGIPASLDAAPMDAASFNTLLMARLAALLGCAVHVRSTTAVGVPPDQVEALAFAWLASAFVARRAGNLPAVTGAAGPRVLGALYPKD